MVIRHNGIRRLELFRYAVHPGEQGERMALLTGTADDICCSLCGRTRSWFAPEEGMRELLELLTVL